jgi:hypothetical protein
MELAGFYLAFLAGSGFEAVRDGPLEDGSYTVSATRDATCSIVVSLAPRGDDEVFVTVFYGAGCAFRWPT